MKHTSTILLHALRSQMLVIAMVVLSAADSPSAGSQPPLPDDQIEAVHEQVVRNLRGLDAGWYDDERDDWRRAEVRVPDEDADGDGSFGLGLTGFGMLMDLVAMILVGTGVTALVLGILNMRLEEPEAYEHAEREPAEQPLVAPRFLDLDLDEAERGDLLAALQTALTDGQWVRAVICGYAAMLVLADRAGAIHLRPGATNRTLLRELADSDRSLLPFGEQAVQRFERVYFGGVEADEESARAQAAEVEAFSKALSARDEKAPS